MRINPFKSVGDLFFNDSVDSIKLKLDNYKLHESRKTILNKEIFSVYIEELDLVITFNQDYKSILSFEFFNCVTDLKYEEVNLSNSNYNQIKKKIAGLDLELEIRKDGFISKKLGFSVWRKIYNNSYLNKVESIFVFSKEYDIDEEIDLDELYESIMSKDYDPDTEVEKWN